MRAYDRTQKTAGKRICYTERMRRLTDLNRATLRRACVLLTVLLVLAVWIFAPFAARSRSLAVMTLYDRYCERDSVQGTLGIRTDLPLEGSGLYPLQVTFSAHDGLSAVLEHEVRFTIDYTFADFPRLRGPVRRSQSAFYDTSSPLYGAYAGVYYLEGLGEALDEQTAFAMPAYDQQYLALPALGLPASRTTFMADGVTTGETTVSCTGDDTWILYEADIVTNGPEHRKDGFLPAYIQFGTPPEGSRNYPLREMRGAVASRYFAKQDLSIGLYVIGRDQTIVDQLMDEVLREASFSGLG